MLPLGGAGISFLNSHFPQDPSEDILQACVPVLPFYPRRLLKLAVEVAHSCV